MPIWDIVSELVPDPTVYLQLIRFMITFVFGTVLTRAFLMPFLAHLLRRRGARKETRHSIVNIGGIVGFFLSFTVALQAGNFGNLVTVIGTVTAALTVAIGFGMRDQVSNLLAGLFIFFDSPFIKGDYIKTEATEGVVRQITLRATTLSGSASQKVVVPNSQLTMEEMKNYTRGARTKSAIGITLRNDKLEKGTGLLKELAEQRDGVLADPEPTVVYTDSDGQIGTELHYWVRDPEMVKQTKSELLKEFNSLAVKRDLFDPEAPRDE